jgi:hypothetical protein
MVMEMFACASISCTILGCVPLYNLSCPLVHIQSRFRVMSYSSRHEASDLCT